MGLMPLEAGLLAGSGVGRAGRGRGRAVAARARAAEAEGGHVSLRFGYVSNGLSDHRLEHALELLAENGYAGVALTLDHIHFDPFAPRLRARARALRAELEELGLSCVVETGARFVLDPRRKHFPTLVCDGRQQRVDLLCTAVDVAVELGAPVVSMWSGSVAAGRGPRARVGPAGRRLRAGARARGGQRDHAGLRARARDAGRDAWPTTRSCRSGSGTRRRSG